MDKRKYMRGLQKKRMLQIQKYVQDNPPAQEDAGSHELLTVYKLKLEMLQDAFDEFTSNQDKIRVTMDITKEDEVRDFEEALFEVHDLYIECRAKLEAYEITVGKAPEHLNHPDEMSFVDRLTHEIKNSSLLEHNSLLPFIQPLKLPSFDGKYNEWASFNDMFTSAVIKNRNLSNSQKLQYLKEALKGEAAQIIRHISITDANFEVAWELVTKRFDKKNYIVQSLVKTFVNLPKCQGTAIQVRNLHSASQEVLRSLAALGTSHESRDPWLIYLLCDKLDHATLQLWANKLTTIEHPKVCDLLDVIEKRCDALEIVSSSEHKASEKKVKALTTSVRPKVFEKKPNKSYIASTNTCIYCTNAKHSLYNCQDFRNASVSSRSHFVGTNNLCLNCMWSGHSTDDCRSSARCFICKGKHNTLLHTESLTKKEASPSQNTAASSTPVASTSSAQVLACRSESTNIPSRGILPTAVIYAQDTSGQLHKVRAVLDSAAEISLISESLVQRLKLPRRASCLTLTGIKDVVAGHTRGVTSLHASSRHDDQSIELITYISKTLTSNMPARTLNLTDKRLLENIPLADPQYMTTAKVDVIIGSDYFLSVIKDGQIKNELGETIAQNTLFGYIVGGKSQFESQTVSINLATLTDLNEIQKFWETEEIPTQRSLTKEEIACEDHFKSTHYRDDTGRYVVQLPLRNVNLLYGNSLTSAIHRLSAMERKFQRDTEFKNRYVNFLAEYEDLTHMKLIQSDQIEDHFYLPHHGVIKEDSTTTKLRVVYDASCKTSLGISLNDNLMVGATIQDDIFTQILRFRSYQFAVTSDIEKMYRQVLVHADHHNFQRIVWRKSIDEPISHFCLTTVTYGTSSAPFLATRALKQLGEDNSDKFPEASHVIQSHFYVDDLLSGADSLEAAKKLQKDLIEVLNSGGFRLRKWCANHPELLENVPEEDRSQDVVNFYKDSNVVKTLGIQWLQNSDIFSIHVNLLPMVTCSKRNLLSDTAKLFDPLGWLAPVIIIAKIMFQELWIRKLDWDDKLPIDLETKWRHFRENLHMLREIQIKRWLPNFRNVLQLHGFSDASELAFAAVVYSRAIDDWGIAHTNIVASKSKVSPIKQISIPRLELCGAVLLARLMEKVRLAYTHLEVEIHLWTDSTITLSWINRLPRTLTTFVANRSTEIINLFPAKHWSHVSTKENPADLSTRGVAPEEFPKSKLWFEGPEWLRKSEDHWPVQSKSWLQSTVIEELKSSPKILIANTILRVTAYCLRFIYNMRNSRTRKSGCLSLKELEDATTFHIQWSQDESFYEEKNLLAKKETLHSKSKLLKLHPFQDDKGVIRVGGRLQNADLSYNQQHPIVLDGKSKFCELLVEYTHLKYLHAGPTLLTSILFQKFWILGHRNLVKRITHKCVTCFRHNAKASTQLMGNIPAVRLKPAHPFTNTGCDFCGPFTIKRNKGRGGVLDKSYICLFICLSTKAIHLELVSDLTTEAFIAALKRFFARRGCARNMYSDNGTNFCGASNQLAEFQKLFNSQANQEIVTRYATSEGVEWHFIPPRAPHFGGIWESNVKAVKFHLKRSICNHSLTSEEMCTVLAQIEACLNSRPLCSLTNDASSTEVLTPAHFLIGKSLTTIAEPSLGDLAINRLNRWQLTQRLYNQFWEKWSVDYISSLQPRTKWQKEEANLKKDDLVIIKEDNIAPSHWALGRITEVHPGPDGKIRVATVRFNGTEKKRTIHKLCKLPME